MAIQGSGSFYTTQAINLVKDVGLQALSTALPREFEWYMIAIELADFDGNTIDYLAFPIMPNSLTKIEQNRTTIRKTATGVTILSSPVLALGELILNGNFGRGFKNLIGLDTEKNTEAYAYSIRNRKDSLYTLLGANSRGAVRGVNFGLGKFDFAIKTGYGVIKMLQAILDKSVGVDKHGRPFKLFFYNLAFGENYQVVVPPNGVKFYQDLSNNMIWCYDLRLSIIAPLEAVSTNKGKWLALASSAISEGVSVAGSVVEDAVSSTLTSINKGAKDRDKEAEKLEGEM